MFLLTQLTTLIRLFWLLRRLQYFLFLAALSLADNPPLGAPLGPPLFPPNPPAFPCLAAATSTLTGLPLKSCPCFSKAFLTASESAKSTCPNPLDFPVSLSLAILAPWMAPQSLKNSLSSSSVH